MNQYNRQCCGAIILLSMSSCAAATDETSHTSPDMKELCPTSNANTWRQKPIKLGLAGPTTCARYGGKRLKAEVLAVLINGTSIADVCLMSLNNARDFMDTLELTEREQAIAAQVLREIKMRLDFLVRVGLSYLDLGRAAGTLSGGEAQRIRLATQIGSGLTGVLYVLDEPSIGLHQRDNRRLIETLLA